jgi:putative heme-binding domain-containing protein
MPDFPSEPTSTAISILTAQAAFALFLPFSTLAADAPLSAAPGQPTEGGWQPRELALKPGVPLAAGPIWLRSWLKVPDNMVDASGSDLWRDSMTLTLQNLPGPVVVFLNGQKIIETRDIPDEPRRFKVPKNIFAKAAYNSLVIRIDGTKAPQGLSVAPVFAGYFDEVRMGRAWQLSVQDPAAGEKLPRETKPPVGAYDGADFHPGTTVLQANPEPVRGKYVSPEEALKLLTVEPDLVVEELLHEPEVAQPTQVSFDSKGRLWVAQYRQYPYPAGLKMISRDQYYRSKYDSVPPPPPGNTPGADIISVHEDTDGDGKYELHKNVLTGLNMANAVLTGSGGIWVMNPPYLLFYPDANGDDVPDGPPQVRLQGFGLEDTHSVANGLAWGPDGWIYGAQGSTTTSRVTRPGVSEEDTPAVFVEGCMVWRYHPKRRRYEIFADGSGNTFGVTFDGEGRLFTGHNGGDTRGWHHVQKGIYLKQGKDPGKFGPPPNPYAFGEMPMMRSTHPVPRFSHLTLMAEGTALPERWRGSFFGADPLHHHIVAAKRLPEGSTFATTDIGFPLRSDDLTFRPVYLANAPDGSMLIADFREEYIAHGQNYQSQIDPATGRIYRLRGKDLPLERDVRLAAKTTPELIQVLSHANPWHRQTAVRLLAERRDPAGIPLLEQQLAGPALHPALEALWTLDRMGELTRNLTLQALQHPTPMVRAWTIRLLGDDAPIAPFFIKVLALQAARETDPEVRCQILSTARRFPVQDALPLTKAIALRTEDVDDPFIPLMVWFVLESHCAENREEVLALFSDAAFWQAPLVRKHLLARIMRRLAQSGTREELIAAATLFSQAPGGTERAALMEGFSAAWQGRALPALPDELMQALATGGPMPLMLRVRQGEPAALVSAMELLSNKECGINERLEAVRIFGEIKHLPAIPALLALYQNPGSNGLGVAACTALQLYDDPAIAGGILTDWSARPANLQAAALNLLGSRPLWSLRLLEAVVEGKVTRSAISPDILSRLRLYKEPALTALLTKHFPVTPPVASAALQPRIDQVRQIIAQKPGDPYKGEPVFTNKCSACHTLFFKGGKIGPDLTSYQRDDLGTMLLSIIDPNAEIREGFANKIVTTKDGRSLSGFQADQDSRTLVLRGFDGADIVLQRDNIATEEPAGFSLMPVGLLDDLSDEAIQNLFAYLRQSQPITK